MTAPGLIWAAVRHRPLPHLLQLALMAFATGLIVLMMLVSHQLQQRAARDAAAVDMVIGAPGSPLQLALAAIYHVDNPTGNIPYEAAQRWAAHRLVAQAVPIALGDSAGGFRIVGTTPEFLALYGATLAEGRVFAGPMEAVIGAEVAASGLAVGGQFAGAHGLSAGGATHDRHRYRVVGSMAATGTVLDRLILTSLHSVWLQHAPDGAPHHDEHEHEHEHERGSAVPDGQGRAITALLLRYQSALGAATLPREVAEVPGLMAVRPTHELLRLRVLANGAIRAAQAFAAALIALAALSMLAALNSALEARRYDLAVMRALGATRWRVVRLLWAEALVLAVIGAVLGAVLARVVAEVLGARLPGHPLTGLAWVPGELWVFVLALAVATLAVVMPAWRAYRVDVAGVLSRA